MRPASRIPIAHTLTLLLMAAASQATVIQVGTVSDAIAVDGRCTLREAVQAANTDTTVNECPGGTGPDIIELFFTSTHVISLAGNNEDLNQTGDFDVRDDLTIRPEDPEAVVEIDAMGLDRVFEVFDGVNLTLERITVRGGNVVGFGGGIFSQQPTSEIRLDRSKVTNNLSTLFGGGIYSEGSLWLVDSSVASNDSAFGGGVYMGTASPLNLLRSDLAANDSTSDGGGANLLVLEATESSINNNDADRHGGGLFFRNEGTGADVSRLINSGVVENGSEEDGGGIYFDSPGTLDLFNATVAWNAADTDEDDVGNGGGILVAQGTVRPQNSIFAANFDFSFGAGAVRAPDCSGAISAEGYNLFAAIDASVCTISGDTTGQVTGTLGSPVDHDMGCPDPFGNMGRVVLPGDLSPALDAGDPAGCAAPEGGELTVDQRGRLRPWDGPDPDLEARCDMGSVELDAPDATFVFADGFESGDVLAWSSSTSSGPKAGAITSSESSSPTATGWRVLALGGCEESS